MEEHQKINCTVSSCLYNGKATKPNNPTRDGYTFKYWSINGEQFDFGTALTSNITLTAEWEKQEGASGCPAIRGTKFTN